MEQLGAVYEGEWTCLSKMYNTTEESDFMAQFLGGLNTIPKDLKPNSKNVARNFVGSSSFALDTEIPDESSSSFLTHETGILFNGSGLENCYFQDGLDDQALETSLSLSVGSDYSIPDNATLENHLGDKQNTPVKNSRKKSRNSADAKSKRNVKPRKILKAESSSEAEDVHESSQTCSENERSSSHKVKPALNLNGRTRAGRGSANDPQSLYARKRRERINERLKTLQGLVPNGTKVDISTMLEEAVQYVKFLQLQIKLLSSDDMWMYAPLAYNGMDIGIFDKMERA